jgi:uncharacterized protein YndB with AHSA1/START domain
MNAKLTVPYRAEFSVEVPGTAEQVWDAIATAKGMSAWFMPTQMEERVGGPLHFEMGPEMGSDGVVTEWDAPRKIVYQEDWAALMGVSEDELSALTSEFVVEAQSGGTCIVRVTSSGFGTGAEWEAGFWESMVENWKPYFDHLRLYLKEFAGQAPASLEANAVIANSADTLWGTLREAAGLGGEGAGFTLRGSTGTVAKAGKRRALVHLTGPVSGMLSLAVFDDGMEEGTAIAEVRGYLFGSDAQGYVDREQSAWKSWLESLPVVG